MVWAWIGSVSHQWGGVCTSHPLSAAFWQIEQVNSAAEPASDGNPTDRMFSKTNLWTRSETAKEMECPFTSAICNFYQTYPQLEVAILVRLCENDKQTLLYHNNSLHTHIPECFGFGFWTTKIVLCEHLWLQCATHNTHKNEKPVNYLVRTSEKLNR